jgi:hypothetical protein
MGTVASQVGPGFVIITLSKCLVELYFIGPIFLSKRISALGHFFLKNVIA